MFYQTPEKGFGSVSVNGVSRIVACTHHELQKGVEPTSELVVRCPGNVVTFTVPTQDFDICNGPMLQEAWKKHDELKADKRALEREVSHAHAGRTNRENNFNKQLAEVKRLEGVCTKWYEDKIKAEQSEKTMAQASLLVSEAKDKQIAAYKRDLEVAEHTWKQTKHEIEKHARSLEPIVASQGKRIQELSKERDEANSLRVLAYETIRRKEERIEHLRGACDRYTKDYNFIQTKFEQATKQAAQWKERALAAEDRLTAPTKMDRVDACSAACSMIAGKHAAVVFSTRNSWAPKDAMGYYSSPLPEEHGLPVRVASLEKRVEKRVEKLEEDGYPISTFDLSPFKDAMLFMYGRWVKGYRNYNGDFLKSNLQGNGHNTTGEEDRANQPTRWKPMPK